MSILLIQEQKDAVEMILSTKGPTRLLGAAGMGKSTTIDALGGNITKAAPTNKAAALIGCQTIHKLLGLTIRKRGGKSVTVPTASTPRGKIHAKTVFDESSCIPKEILDKYILPIFTNPVFVGDEAQLNPIAEPGEPKSIIIPFMQDESWPTTRLKTCHRFGEELYDVAMANRKSVLEGGVFSVPASWGVTTDFLLENFKEGDVVIAWRNATVKRYNNILKRHFFGTTDWCVNEKVRIGEFFEPKRLANESEWVIVDKLQPIKTYGLYADVLRLRGESGDVVVPVLQEQYVDDLNEQLKQLAEAGNWRHYWGLKNSFCDVRPSFAITAHKSQGSTYDTVYPDLNDIFANEWKQEAVRAAYVATTRARKKVWSLL